jgi:hypothetical protein
MFLFGSHQVTLFLCSIQRQLHVLLRYEILCAYISSEGAAGAKLVEALYPVTLGSIELLTDMGTRNISWEVKTAGV